ncbi:hypothetical protein [Hymenobacter sediminicola]|uniref:PorT family protein n=1 Tax=Hymenobacter sediminicola TaxID=2761579 RepID=A0A7G7W9H8_9BACT|nr:hypothetical protein [Hymenobacter sediminicola]QNH63021.1 hypothetical protein H4317_04210 [Hymenobacter sediminicola]
MRTPPMSDEELDELVRRSAEAYPDEVPLGAWLLMEDQLNEATMQQQVQQRVKQQVRRLFMLELLLVALALWWWQARPVPPATPNQLNSGTARSATKKTSPTPEKAVSPATQATLSRQNQAGTARVAPMSAKPQPVTTELPELERPPVVSSSRLFAKHEANSVLGGSTIALSKSEAQQRRNKKSLFLPLPERVVNGVASKAFISDPESAGGNAVQQSARSLVSHTASEAQATTKEAADAVNFAAGATSETPTKPEETAAKPVASLPGLSTPNDSTLVPTADTTNDSGAKKQAPERPAYRVLLGVVGAPELTAVHPTDLTRPGTTVGVMIEYRFAPRWRVRSGLLRSVKLYSARGTDYKPPSSYWTWRTPVDEIEADCRILEIPVDLRYELLQRPTYSVFASAGLTSLVMRNEQYTYKYDLNGQYTERTWSYAGGGKHPFSILNLSVGYERNLGARWAAQAEPFLKLPLGGVGFGKIYLRSAGVSFGLKYGLLRPQTAQLVP